MTALLGCLLLPADAGEGRDNMSAGVLAFSEALIAEGLAAVFSPADGGSAAAVVGCLLATADVAGGT